MDAQIQLEKLLSQGVDRTELAAYLGEAALAQGNLDQARDWLSAGAFSKGTMALGYRMLGRLALAEGDLAEAGRAFDRAYTIDPDDPELWVDIGRLRYRGGEQFQAIEASERAVALDPKNAAALQFRGQLARDAQGMAVGVAWFSHVLAQQPNNVELRVEYAAALGDA
ncbi:tetratricopeptide repeat protein [Erythrobacter mangrovi]|uniref:Tetratricopeptide repeat protein n=2 Tax=Erythrobacter mangrovi TaxID=2739433 RepID=A0A7D3XIL7_9SPHN|nr:tetratricopeptide repeat protein [Erythrobacter mangrovi]